MINRSQPFSTCYYTLGTCVADISVNSYNYLQIASCQRRHWGAGAGVPTKSRIIRTKWTFFKTTVFQTSLLNRTPLLITPSIGTPAQYTVGKRLLLLYIVLKKMWRMLQQNRTHTWPNLALCDTWCSRWIYKLFLLIRTEFVLWMIEWFSNAIVQAFTWACTNTRILTRHYTTSSGNTTMGPFILQTLVKCFYSFSLTSPCNRCKI